MDNRELGNLETLATETNSSSFTFRPFDIKPQVNIQLTTKKENFNTLYNNKLHIIILLKYNFIYIY